MHAESMDGWTHDHVFLGADHGRNEHAKPERRDGDRLVEGNWDWVD